VEGRLPVPARATRQAAVALALVVTLIAAPAFAVPKNAKAKAAFQEGIAAYGKQDYAGAAEAFGRSFGLEEDIETLFAWAQAERQAEHCDKAVELYRKLLSAKLPDANRQVVTEKMAECLKIIAAKEPPPVEPTPDPEPPKVDKEEIRKPPPAAEGKSRWRDPLGGVLVGAGAIGLGVGGFFLVKSHGAAADSKSATDHATALDLKDKAKSQGQIGVIAAAAGGALLVGGIVRYATRKSERDSVVSMWLTPDAAGVVALGRF
jgi:hypothetical protein